MDERGDRHGFGKEAGGERGPGGGFREAAAGFAPASRGDVVAKGRALRGRGARSRRAGRFEALRREAADDGWGALQRLAAERERTTVHEEIARSIVSRNASPDVCFDQSVNPYRGCEHGCIYCYARPGHANLGLSPGLDFESRLSAKVNAPELLERAMRRPSWRPDPLALAPWTDAWQPIERRYRITRRLLEVAEAFGQPLGLITKSALIMRDVDILSRMARRGLVKVAISITTLDATLARMMEPRAATPARRLEAIGALADAGVPVAVLVSPVVPGLTDHELEAILARARAAGAREAGYGMLRLPGEVSPLFREWLRDLMPNRARRVISLVRAISGGRDYDHRFHRRMKGAGPLAWAIGRRFELAARRLGLLRAPLRLSRTAFRPPRPEPEQPLLPGIGEEEGRGA